MEVYFCPADEVSAFWGQFETPEKNIWLFSSQMFDMKANKRKVFEV